MSDKKSTILLIEDEEMLSNMYEIKFVKEGYQVKKALDGEIGFKMASEGVKPDLILLDIIMPKLDGFTVLKNLKANASTKDIPVILLTNLGQDEDIKKGNKLGATGYLIKANLTPAQVVEKIKEVLK
ncbi:response regulator [bacterium]|jgi:DNA-binding response OmpR family regulator|nr:response regulator [bacterium]MBT4121371.1 response regulator [bacterium]MBT4335055.1 response regulator [bacterium]MBT4495252.1 response regulator [bacterium]MBT4763861.1 response regulator [bacterium]